MTLAVLFAARVTLAAQVAEKQHPSEKITIHGVVLNSKRNPVADATVRLEEQGASTALEARTSSAGEFSFFVPQSKSYLLSAEKSGQHSRSVVVSGEQPNSVELLLEDGSAVRSDAMEFADKPNFTVAGVVDWTAVGGHGSDATLRTSEALARETTTLKPEAAQQKTVGSTEAEAHRLAGERAEKSGDPLSAVHEFEQAARLDPSEENYFAWGSELLLHRAVWQAQEVFSKGAAAYPKSARIQTGLGTALFAGAHYDEAALRLCEAAELNPTEAAPYIFLGKAEIASPTPLPCVEQKLAQFAKQEPDNSFADYFYAMAILKRQEQAPDPQAKQQAEALLSRAVTVDNKCGDAYLQLGILSSVRRDLPKAIDYYSKAIDANPQLGEAHFRLAVAYDRMGESAKAKQEFELHTQIEKQQADAIESQRREVKQFLVVLQGQPNVGQAH